NPRFPARPAADRDPVIPPVADTSWATQTVFTESVERAARVTLMVRSRSTDGPPRPSPRGTHECYRITTDGSAGRGPGGRGRRGADPPPARHDPPDRYSPHERRRPGDDGDLPA